MRLTRKISFWVSLIGVATLCVGISYPIIHQAINSDASAQIFFGQPNQGKIPKKFSESAWGKVGEGAYQAAARVMASNNASGQALDEMQKRYLRPHFGDLVDRVTIVYNATLMDEWVAASFRIDVGKSNAQVYGRRIYISAAYQASDVKQLILLAHELIHVRQYEKLGSVDKFGYQYFKEYKRAGQRYKDNKMEREAFEFERKFAKWLSEEMAKSAVKKEGIYYRERSLNYVQNSTQDSFNVLSEDFSTQSTGY